jgi:hypothetical protein
MNRRSLRFAANEEAALKLPFLAPGAGRTDTRHLDAAVCGGATGDGFDVRSIAVERQPGGGAAQGTGRVVLEGFAT